MRGGFVASIGALAVVIAVVLMWAQPVVGQAQSSTSKATAAKTWSPPRTPDGQPDLQGIWTNATITPLERPAELAGKEFFTEAEAAEYAKEVIARTNADRRDGTPEADVGRAYNNFWWDRGTNVVKTRRTSLIVDPPDGKIPPLTPEGQKRQTERVARNKGHEFDGPENRPLGERCVIWASTGPPTLPTAYNNNLQIVQTPGYVMVLIEMIHDARVIPLDGRPHLPQSVRQWKGDSRGHWEGDTLVVETTNFTDKNPFRGASENMRLMERFRRVDADTLMYQFTVDDETSFTKAWTAEIPLNKTAGPIFEYACHEGNYAMSGGLGGARVEEKKAAEEAAKQGSR